MEENRKAVLEQVLLDFVEVTDNFDRALEICKNCRGYELDCQWNRTAFKTVFFNPRKVRA